MKILKLYTAVILSIFSGLILSSCVKPACLNKNTVFEKFDPNTKEYKDELYKLIRETDKNDLRFWISDATLKDTSEQIIIDIRGKDVCAKMTVQNLTDKKFNKAGYRGAELLGAQFAVKSEPNEAQFDLLSFVKIID